MIKNITQLLLFAILFSPSVVSASVFLNKETLTYDIQISGIDMGEAKLSMIGKKLWKGKDTYALWGNVKSNSKWGSIFPIDNVVATVYNAEKSKPLYTEMEFDTNRKLRNYNIWFNSEPSGSVKVEKSTKQNRQKIFRAKISKNAQDLLSWFYYLRTLELDVGKVFSFTIFSGNYSYTAKCKVEKIEPLETRLGNHSAYVISMKVTRDGSKKFTRSATLWVDSSGTKVPLKAKTRTKLGSTEITLSSISKKQL
jgi:hypothetical protein